MRLNYSIFSLIFTEPILIFTKDYVIKEIDPCVLDCIYLGLMKIEIDLNLASHDEYFEMLRENVGCDCEVDDAEECL